MAGRGRPRLYGMEECLEAWQNAWDGTDMSVPFPLIADKALSSIGSNCALMKIECARIVGRPEKDRTKLDHKILEFYSRTMSAQNSVLQERMMTHPPGQIHIAKCLHGMRDVQEVQISGKSLEDVING